MWRYFQFPHNCHKWKAEISPHDNVFSTNNISDISDKYQVCSKPTPCFPIRDSRILQFVEPRCRWSASATWSASEFESKLKVLLGGYLTIVLVVHHGTMEDTQTKCQGCRPLLVAAHRTIWKLLPLHPLPTSPLQLTQNAGSWHCTHIWLLYLCQFLFRPRRTIFTFGDSFV